MTREGASRAVKVVARRRDPVSAYASGLSTADAKICRALRAAIDAVLPSATARVWHRAPVWFIATTPVVGYNATSNGGVNLLFWNGRAFKDPALKPIGKFKAAQIHFDEVAQIDSKALRRWLKRAKTEIWDYSAIRRRKSTR